MGGIEIGNAMKIQDALAVDTDVLDLLERKLGRQLVLRLVALFREAAARRHALLEAAMHDNDFAALRQLAHDLVSEAASIGAHGLSDAARRIEMRALARQDTVFAEAERLEALAQDVETALDRIFGKGP